MFVNESYKCLIENNPKITNIYTEKDWFANWGKIVDIISSGEYDEVMIPQQLHPEDNVWHQLEEYRHQHLVDFYLQRCRLPKRTKEESLQLYVTDEDRAEVERFITQNNINNYIVIHTKTLANGKDWSGFQKLVDSLVEIGRNKGWAERVKIIQVGKKTDKLINETIDARERLTIPQIGLLAQRAKCFIGLDSGLSYIAAAAGARVIVIQGSTIPETSGPWGDNVTNIVSKTNCDIRCHGNCKKNAKCIDTIKVEEVLEAINEKEN